MMKKRNIPVLEYVKRYWLLLAAILVLIVAYRTGTIALSVRGLFLIPIFTLTAAAAALLLRNVYNRHTTDRYVHSRRWLEKDWSALTPFQRIVLLKLETLVYFLGGCLVAAGLVIVIHV